MRSLAAALALTFAAAAAPAQHAPAPHEHGERHGNPADLEGYIASMEEPGRAAWQKPDQVVGALGLAKGQTACDIGSGPGYFSLRLARAVAPGPSARGEEIATVLSSLQSPGCVATGTAANGSVLVTRNLVDPLGAMAAAAISQRWPSPPAVSQVAPWAAAVV